MIWSLCCQNKTFTLKHFFIVSGCFGYEPTVQRCQWHRRKMGSGVCDHHPNLGLRCQPFHHRGTVWSFNPWNKGFSLAYFSKYLRAKQLFKLGKIIGKLTQTAKIILIHARMYLLCWYVLAITVRCWDPMVRSQKIWNSINFTYRARATISRSRLVASPTFST